MRLHSIPNYERYYIRIGMIISSISVAGKVINLCKKVKY